MQADRAAAVLPGAACGDALGVPSEFGTVPLPAAGEPPRMLGGGLGEYAQMAVCITEVTATGRTCRTQRRSIGWRRTRNP